MRSARLWSGVVPKSSAPRAAAPVSRSFFVPAPVLRSFFTSSQPFTTSQSQSGALTRNALLFFRSERSLLARRWRSIRSKSDKATPAQPEPPESALSFSQRMKKLSREYGWTAVGVYFGLSVLDFPFCFLAVRALGAEKIGHYEHIVVEFFKNTFGIGNSKPEHAGAAPSGGESALETAIREGDFGLADDIQEAEAANQGAGASIWTELALAYAIHKSFIFIRVPATAAVLPKVVKTLRKWGYDIGKRKPKSS